MVTEQDIIKREAELQAIEAEALQFSGKPIPQRRFGSNVTSKQQQEVISNRQKAQQALIQVKEQRKELKDIRDAIEYNRQVSERNAKQEEMYSTAQKYAFRGAEGDVLASQESKEFQRIYRNVKAGIQPRLEALQQYKDMKAQGLTPNYDKTGKLVGFSDSQLGTSYSVDSISSIVQKNPEQQARYEKVGFTFSQVPKTETFKNTTNTSNFGVTTNELVQSNRLNAVSTGETNRSSSDNLGLGPTIQKTYNLLKEQGQTAPVVNYKSLIGIGFPNPFPRVSAGAGASIIESVAVGKQLITTPVITTIKNIAQATTPEGFKNIAITTFKEAKANPQFFIGETIGDLVISASISKGLTKVIDYTRTAGLGKIPTPDIVAPEYYMGQIFPKLKKGETAGQLLKEFKPQLPGETKAGGFTALPNPVKSPTIRGGSELPGLYQAPKLSPKFLGIGGETKVVSLNVFETMRPSAIRVIPKTYKLAPGVSASQSKIAVKSKRLIEFFNTKAEKGVSYIPFIKTEKESIIPFNTELVSTGKNFYFSFKGRRVPIFEFETAGAGAGVSTAIAGKGITTARQVSSYYSYSTTSSGVINPLSLSMIFSKYKSSASTPSSTPSIPSIPSYPSTPSISSYPKSPPKSYPSSSYNISSTISTSYISPSIKSSYSPSFKSGYSSKGLSSYSPLKISRGTSPKSSYSKYNKKSIFNVNLVPGFRTFVFKMGKQTYLPGIRSKGGALRFGSKQATKTLRATFGITPTTKIVKGTRGFTPSTKIFRGYRIQKGKRISLNNIFIQKTRKEGGLRGGRLAFGSEIKAIKASKRLKFRL